MFERLRRKYHTAAGRLYYIEINDVKIDKDISRIITDIERKLHNFKRVIDQLPPQEKDRKLTEFYEELIGMKQRVETLKKDVKQITEIELQNKEYFIIKDDSYLQDKNHQLQRLTSEISELLQIAEQNPTKDELKDEFIPEMISQIDDILKATQHIIEDDYNLRLLYREHLRD